MDRTMTVGEVARYLHVHPSTVYRLAKKRQLPAFRIGGNWRFDREMIDRWRLEQEGENRGPSRT